MGAVRKDKIIGYDFDHNPFGEGTYCLKCIPETLTKCAREGDFVMEWFTKEYIYFCDFCGEQFGEERVD